jgi:hypothetical protein
MGWLAICSCTRWVGSAETREQVTALAEAHRRAATTPAGAAHVATIEEEKRPGRPV